MKQTQIAAIIRVDYIRPLMEPINFDKIFDTSWIGDSIKKNIWENPDESHMAAYTVSIFGDVNQNIDESKIIEWFKCNISDVWWTRQACITVNTSDGKTLSWHLDKDKKEE